MALEVLNGNSGGGDASSGDIKIGKIEVDRELCIGAESCVIVAPEAFEMDDENLAVLKDNAIANTDVQTLFESAQACPVAAIILYDESGNQVYP